MWDRHPCALGRLRPQMEGKVRLRSALWVCHRAQPGTWGSCPEKQRSGSSAVGPQGAAGHREETTRQGVTGLGGCVPCNADQGAQTRLGRGLASRRYRQQIVVGKKKAGTGRDQLCSGVANLKPTRQMGLLPGAGNVCRAWHGGRAGHGGFRPEGHGSTKGVLRGCLG